MTSRIRLPLLLAFIASLTGGVLAAAEQSSDAYLIHLTSLVDSDHNLLFADGDSESKVLQAIGQPDSVIDGTVWVYRRFGRGEVRYASPNHACDTILVAFNPAAGRSERRVCEIARVNSANVAAVAAAMIKDPKYVPNRVAAAREATLAPAAPAENPPFLIHVTAVEDYDGSVLFRDGDSEASVLKAVGEPSEILPGEVWAYRQYARHRLQRVRHVTDRQGCETTLITFTPGAPGSGRTITSIVMANPSSLATVVGNLKKDPEYLQKRVAVWHQGPGEVRASVAVNR